MFEKRGIIESIITNLIRSEGYWFDQGSYGKDEIEVLNNKTIRMDIKPTYYKSEILIKIMDTPDGVEAISLHNSEIKIKDTEKIKKIILILLNYCYLYEYTKQRIGNDDGYLSVLKNENKFHNSDSFKRLIDEILNLKKKFKELVDLETFIEVQGIGKLMKKNFLIEKLLSEIPEKKRTEEDRERIRKKVERRENSLEKLVGKKMKKNQSYFGLIELLYKNENILSSLLNESIENIPQENERIVEKNYNRNSKKVNDFTKILEKKMNNIEILKIKGNKNYSILTNPIIQDYYSFLRYNKSNSLKIEQILKNQISKVKKINEGIDNYDYELENNNYTILYIKLNELEIRNKLKEEMKIQDELRGSYDEKCSLERYNEYSKVFNLNSLKEMNIKELCEIIFNKDKIEKKEENRIRRFLFKQPKEKYSKIQNVFRIKESYLGKKISDVDSNINVYYYQIIAALKEFVYLKNDSYTPLNKGKSYNKTPYNILRNFDEKEKISEAYEYYVFLKLMRGISREEGLSDYFDLFHQLDKEYNEFFFRILGIYNLKTQELLLEKNLTILLEELYNLKISTKGSELSEFLYAIFPDIYIKLKKKYEI